MVSKHKPMYVAALFAYAMELKGWDKERTAEMAGISEPSVDAALAGKLKTTTKLRPLADCLGIIWKHLFDVDLPESKFRQAVNGKK